MAFAAGKRALAICDRCGRSCKLLSMKTEFVKGHEVKGIKVCTECFDPDHPQNWFGEKSPHDSEALRDPRPDTDPGR